MTTVKRVPVVEGLFAETAQGPRLLGSRCLSCETTYFPKVDTCHNPDCKEKKVQDTSFGHRGKIWTFTIMYYPPVAPAKYDKPFSPYAVARVDLQDGIRVTGRISSADDLNSIQVGKEVELILETLYHDQDGNERTTWKFKLV